MPNKLSVRVKSDRLVEWFSGFPRFILRLISRTTRIAPIRISSLATNSALLAIG